jgi:type II secretory pathway pseudopilin PulG
VRPRRRDAGGTVIEVLISLALVVIGLLGVYAAYTASVGATAHGRRVTQATTRAERQLEILRNAPSAAIRCLAGGATSADCWVACCQGLGDAGATACTPNDGGVGSTVCQLTPPADPDATGITYTYQNPVVLRDVSFPDLYATQVQVDYSTGDEMGGTTTRSVVLRTQLYKP